MDSRKALRKNTRLRFNNGCEYIIVDELARGGSSIVYNSFYYDNLNEKKTVRIKECYPFQCNLERGLNGELIIPTTEAALFESSKQRILKAYQLGNAFFHTNGLTNLTANTYNIFHANNTLYIVSAYFQGQELSYQKYETVKDSITVVKSVADTIRKIHNKGFLYLDIKPNNVMTLEGTAELIQLFDFDTLIPISSVTNTIDSDSKISYTKGFSALEQQLGDFQKIGKQSDVYGIGALLFYMLFNRVPDAFDCELEAEYDFSKSKLSHATYQDTLSFKLTDFFHNTLADYYLDRFSNMETVVEKLAELQALANLSAKYIHGSKISKPNLFLGRNTEVSWITEKLLHTTDCFFIVGMGGIGKSTLVRHCIKQNEKSFDTILYLNYADSIEKTIIDDYSVHINSVKKDKTETNQAYFGRKLGSLQELGKNKKCVLILDNYTGDNTDALPKLLQLGWNIIFITRNKSLSEGFASIEIQQISEKSDLLTIFAKNIGHELTDDEKYNAISIIENVKGHTLVIELIAKQIGSPFCNLSVEKAAEIVYDSGFSKIAVEKVNYQKDNKLYHDTIKEIISELFEADNLSTSQSTILKILSLFGRNGISINMLCEMLNIDNKDDIGVLYRQGWLYIENTIMSMHPVIEEVVSNWNFSETSKDATTKVFLYLYIKLRVETQKEEYPKHLLKYIQQIKEKPETAFDKWLNRQIRRISDPNFQNWTKAIFENRIESFNNSVITNHEKVKVYLLLAVTVLEKAKKEPEIYALDIYNELLYYTIKNMPYENENYIREKSEELISLGKNLNEKILLKIYHDLLEILYDHGEYELAKQKIEQAKKMITGTRNLYVWGQYYYILGGYYDALLNGFYDAVTEKDAELVQLLLNSVDKAIKYMRFSNTADSGLILGEYYRFKALVLIRSGIGTKKQVQAILEKIQKLIDKYAQSHSRLVRDYFMTLAWYHTYLDEDIEKTYTYLHKATEITDIISISELDKIDDLLSPSANILLEWQQYDESSKYLLRSIVICDKYLEITAYKRKQIELLGHLLQVYFYAKEYKKCRTTIKMIDEKISKTPELNSDDFIPLEIRTAVANSNKKGNFLS